MKEQQLIINSLQAEVAKLSGKSKEKSATVTDNKTTAAVQAATLNQNIPNPFSETTRIDMYLPGYHSQYQSLYL